MAMIMRKLAFSQRHTNQRPARQRAKENGPMAGLSPMEELALMVPGQSAIDFYRSKLTAIVTKCPDIPPSSRPMVVDAILKGEVGSGTGKELPLLVRETASRLGLLSGASGAGPGTGRCSNAQSIPGDKPARNTEDDAGSGPTGKGSDRPSAERKAYEDNMWNLFFDSALR